MRRSDDPDPRSSACGSSSSSRSRSTTRGIANRAAQIPKEILGPDTDVECVPVRNSRDDRHRLLRVDAVRRLHRRGGVPRRGGGLRRGDHGHRLRLGPLRDPLAAEHPRHRPRADLVRGRDHARQAVLDRDDVGPVAPPLREEPRHVPPLGEVRIDPSGEHPARRRGALRRQGGGDVREADRRGAGGDRARTAPT